MRLLVILASILLMTGCKITVEHVHDINVRGMVNTKNQVKTETLLNETVKPNAIVYKECKSMAVDIMADKPKLDIRSYTSKDELLKDSLRRLKAYRSAMSEAKNDIRQCVYIE